jgi:hypothetical protein
MRQNDAIENKIRVCYISCKFLSDKSGASDRLEELGFNVEYVGALISDSIKAGYTPMVF